MKHQPEHKIEQLIIRYLNQDCTEMEAKELKQWLTENSAHQKQFDSIKLIWNSSESMNDFSTINIAEDWEKTRTRMNFNQSQTESRHKQIRLPLNPFVKIAALILILLSIGFLLNHFVFQNVQQLYIYSGIDKKQVNLPDGSVVHMNTHSHLTYSESFQDNERIVKLSGEAYFEVTQNPDQPFKIIAEDEAIIEVLGTAFNVFTDKESKDVKVNVSHGTVAFYSRDFQSSKVILHKDEAGLYSQKHVQISAENDLNYLSWKTGILQFDNKDLSEAIRELEEFYNYKISFKDISIDKLKLTASFNNQNLHEVVDELALIFGLEYSDKNGKIVLFIPD